RKLRRETRRARSRAIRSINASMELGISATRGDSGIDQDRGSLTERIHGSQVRAGSRVVDVEAVAFHRAGEQQRLGVLRHLDGANLVAHGNSLHSPVMTEIVYPDLVAEILMRLRAALMHDRE